MSSARAARLLRSSSRSAWPASRSAFRSFCCPLPASRGVRAARQAARAPPPRPEDAACPGRGLRCSEAPRDRSVEVAAELVQRPPGAQAPVARRLQLPGALRAGDLESARLGQHMQLLDHVLREFPAEDVYRALSAIRCTLASISSLRSRARASSASARSRAASPSAIRAVSARSRPRRDLPHRAAGRSPPRPALPRG